MYPSLFVLGMVEYVRLSVRRDVALVTYVWCVPCRNLHQPDILERLRLCAPDGYVGARRQPPTLSLPVPARTNLLQYAPVSRAIRLINLISKEIDIFNCTLPNFREAAQRYLTSNEIIL